MSGKLLSECTDHDLVEELGRRVRENTSPANPTGLRISPLSMDINQGDGNHTGTQTLSLYFNSDWKLSS